MKSKSLVYWIVLCATTVSAKVLQYFGTRGLDAVRYEQLWSMTSTEISIELLSYSSDFGSIVRVNTTTGHIFCLTGGWGAINCENRRVDNAR